MKEHMNARAQQRERRESKPGGRKKGSADVERTRFAAFETLRPLFSTLFSFSKGKNKNKNYNRTQRSKDEEEALAIANDTLYGLGAGVWSREANTCYRFGRAIKAGRVWTNCYHAYPAHAAFGGYKQSGIGRETHKMMLDHYQQTKNMLVSYSPKKLGFF